MHVPRLYAYGRDKHFEYIAMELCGPPLGGCVMPVSEIFEPALQLLDGLEAIHSAGILYGDIKPKNILLCPSRPGVPQRAVICDFGLARSLSSAASAGATHFIGSLHYGSRLDPPTT
ncbi:kinase-like protein [Calocera viscosa TUFC12733]|uniref:Kinase-like protein n=1 Tax=Calocera viscosa (strain TUFC12733) TaxID=1330018 RepID=A0A167L882_CALVF|nr:kinase-like protein [Calocera viscosa TUFC12733]